MPRMLGRRVALAVAGGVVLAAVAPPATATIAAAQATSALQIEAGYADHFVPGRPMPVRVTVRAERFVRGTLTLSSASSGEPPVSVRVEVPGSSVKRYVVVLPTPSRASDDEIVARLASDDGPPLATRARVSVDADTELVGLLPGALAGRPVPGVAPLAVDAGTARFHALTEAELARAPASLGPLSTVVAAPGELAALSEGARRGVLQWLSRGGRLLVDAAAGTAEPGLPEEWRPATARGPAGRGEVAFTDGAVAAGRWDRLVEPTGYALAGSGSGAFERGFNDDDGLAADAGLRAFRLEWLWAFLLVYVALVGPVTFVVLRRRGRAELAWAVVPLIAVLFTTGSYGAGRQLRGKAHAAHATILETGPAGTMATSFIGVVSRNGGTREVVPPAGWSLGRVSDGTLPATQFAVMIDGNRTEAKVPLQPGAFGAVRGDGPVAATGGLELHGSVDGAGVATGTVRNASGVDLERVVVMLGPEHVDLGTIRAGQSLPWRVDAPPADGRLRHGRDPMRDEVFWNQFEPDQGGRGVVSRELWTSYRRDVVDLRAPGVAVAAGWTRDLQPGVRVGGARRTLDGRTLVVGRAPVTGAEGRAPALAVRRTHVRGNETDAFRGLGNGAPRMLFRFVLPPGAPTDRLVVDDVGGNAEVWIDGTWKPLGGAAAAPRPVPGGRGIPIVPPPGQGEPGRIIISEPEAAFAQLGGTTAIPPAAARSGLIFMRVPLGSFFQPLVREATG